MNKKLDFDIAWGGYYATISEDEEQISVFRLLDFNRDAYHVSLFSEKFEHVPSIKDIESLSPFAGHAPIDSRGLLNYKKIVLIGSKDLTKEDLVGYMYYLEHFEVSEEERSKLTSSLIGFGKEPPLKITLSIKDGELQLNERK